MEMVGELSSWSPSGARIGAGTYREKVADRVFHPANAVKRREVNELLFRLIEPTSRIVNIDSLMRLEELSMRGESCLILAEHYSVMDLPNLLYLLEKSGPAGTSLAERTVAVAGVKVYEKSLAIRYIAEAYDLLMTVPPRQYRALAARTHDIGRELARAKRINIAMLREMSRLKCSGRVILMYPAGTRYRRGNEGTRRALLMTDSYLKAFDNVVFLGMAGNTLQVNGNGESMDSDILTRDRIVFVVSRIHKCAGFREDAVRGNVTGHSDVKQLVSEAVTAELSRLHDEALGIYRLV